jgi:hypothetical protein
VRVLVKSSFPVYVIQACMWSRDIGPLILDLDTVWRCVVIFSKGMYTRHALSRWLAGWTLTGRFGDEKHFLFLLGIEPRIVQPVAKSLHPLRYPLAITVVCNWYKTVGFSGHVF